MRTLNLMWIVLLVLIQVLIPRHVDGFKKSMQPCTGSVGREFYVGILKPYDTTKRIELLISATTSGSVTVKAPAIGMNHQEAIVNGTASVSISNSIIQAHNNGIHITSDVDISLSVITFPSDTYEGFLALPVQCLSTEYIISSYTSDDRYQYTSEYLLVGIHNSTNVTIYSRVNNRQGSSLTVKLNEMQTYLHQSRSDLSGSVIQCDQPIAVFSGHEVVFIPVGSSYGEYIVEQMPPTSTYGRDYIVPSIPPTTTYLVRIYPSKKNTTITYTNTGITKSILLDEMGEFFEVSNNDPVVIYGSQPIMIVQYGYNSYEFMSVVPSVSQYMATYQFTVSSQFSSFTNYLVIIIKTHELSGLLLDGSTLPNTFSTRNVTYNGTPYNVNVYRVHVGPHHLHHTNGQTFGAMLYGSASNGSHGSYGYPLGVLFLGNDCGLPNNISNGHVISNGTLHDAVALYSCNNGFDIVGNMFRTCQYNGSWTNFSPVCERKDCGPLNNISNGHVDVSNGTLHGAAATYSCNIGYDIAGTIVKTCQDNGIWTQLSPVCLRKDCGTLSNIPNGNVDLANGTRYGSVVTYTCYLGYDIHGNKSKTCQAGGTWTSSTPSCVIRDCGNLSNIPNGYVDLANGTLYESIATYTCKHGYDIVGNKFKACLADGIWTSSTPSCVITDCGTPSNITNGYADLASGTLYGSVATYSCNQGYNIVGNKSKTCQADGTWTSSTPSCIIRASSQNASSNGSMCFDCKDMSHLYLCDTVSRCTPTQVCYVERITTHIGQIKYNTGCRESSQCQYAEGNNGQRRSTECLQCCSGDYCNSHGCGGQGLPQRTERGPMCFDCAYVETMEECKTVTMCADNQVCGIETHVWGGKISHISASCDSRQCSPSKRSVPDIHVRSIAACHRCCREDFCNTECNENTNPVPDIIG